MDGRVMGLPAKPSVCRRVSAASPSGNASIWFAARSSVVRAVRSPSLSGRGETSLLRRRLRRVSPGMAQQISSGIRVKSLPWRSKSCVVTMESTCAGKAVKPKSSRCSLFARLLLLTCIDFARV